MEKTKKQKADKIKRTPKQKAKIALNILLCIVLIILIIAAFIAIVNMISAKSNQNFIEKSISAVEYSSQLAPEKDEDGCYTFTTDDDFNVMQLTDVHIGGGFMSVKKDNMAINAVAAMVTEEKPDLVIITGDIAYPVPFQAGTFNNKTGAETFAQLMEKLGVYWAPAFGNHDTEAYSYFSREDIAKIYNDKEKYPHCLFQSGPEEVDGVGNYVVNVKNTKGEITQNLYMIDSHSYTDNDYFGIMWKYDCIHKNQIEWYENQVAQFTEENGGVTPKSLAFFHIPLIEMQQAYYEYRDNGFKDTENVKYNYGKAGEHKDVVFSSHKNNGMFDAMLNAGSTQGVFFGHDHLNNFSLNYKGINLTYGYSIDYLAYSGISKFGTQRGCTMIDIKPDGSYESRLENYYQDKYRAVNTKENVSMGDYYGEEE